ncbi:MAG: glycosyltransferase [Chloroflexota bacterium]
MKVLLAVPELPFPPRRGASIRTWHLLCWLAANHEVSLLSFGGSAAVPRELSELCRAVRLVPVPRRTTTSRLRDLAGTPLPDLALRFSSPEMERTLEEWLRAERFDVLQIESLEMSLAWLRASRRLPLASWPWTVLDELNAEYLLQWRAFRADLSRPRRWPWALYSLVQTAKLRSYEGRVCRRFDRVIAVCDEDAAALRALAPAVRLAVLPNGVDCAYFAFQPPVTAARQQVVFTGTMDFRPNADAVTWFAEAIWPRVRKRVPRAHFVIVGANPSAAVRGLASGPGISVTGGVPDVRPYLRASAAYALPMRIGGGIRLKALEAMAAGLPVVSTSLGCSGTTAEPGRHYWRADDAQSFAAQLVEVLLGERDSTPLLHAARSLVEEQYEWHHLAHHLEAAFPPRTAASRAT